ncbi:PREDICTED: nitrilase homolog 1-like isoform X2 [Priapulus caudatus]|nr:PREDICTED: nitrilase homolog 1-like isoform X2 [Priapulus caudatus]XP_014676514.1 PREDICTED: nitrilase homolog 1-like isoform X2 [Priapulus caudatus]XP_014676515.1 PREDICTED: nitrilase homolog 1-like isoform X2 [Priapulus caudatus]XP_014676516.1 PREDICTED: nitrilase homolog 1-like isoform X2 [Priapulus caudatus]
MKLLVHLLKRYIYSGRLTLSLGCNGQRLTLATMPKSNTLPLPEKTLIGICQMTSTADKKANLATCTSLVESAAKKGAQMVYLPECSDYLCEAKSDTISQAESLDGDTVAHFMNLAKEHNVWLSVGGIHEKGSSADADRVYITHLIINSSGHVVSVYRKLHLFSVDIKGGVRLRESDVAIPGKDILLPVQTPVGKVGMAICYDLRFPEMSLILRSMGADVLTYPSAFTLTTGMAHWEVLLRARAIETQCYVVAAAQMGRHGKKRASYGHAMVVDPWGCVVSCCHEGTGIAIAEIDQGYIRQVREMIPVMEHRRTDLYGVLTANSSPDGDREVYMFGTHPINASHVFYRSTHSFAFVNRKPVVPGHVLVAPLRAAEKFRDLTSAEVCDMFSAAQTIERQLSNHHSATSATIAVQDGADAGQTVNHVHVHILPRKPGDFQHNDDIYEKLENHDKRENQEHRWRTDSDMAAEASVLRDLFACKAST